jgi:hypothetical protein
MQHIWKFDTAHFSIILDAELESDPDLSWDESGEVREKLASGEWTNYCFCLRVLLNGREISADYLGNSIYADATEFCREHYGLATKPRAAGVLYGAYFPDMVRTAVHATRAYLCNVPTLRRVES